MSERVKKRLDSWELKLIGRRWRYYWSKTGKSSNSNKNLDSAGKYWLHAYFFAESGVGLKKNEDGVDVDEASSLEEEIEGIKKPLIRREMTRDELIRWHMPIERHLGNKYGKIWSRISLGLTAAKPTVTFTPDQIIDIEDTFGSLPPHGPQERAIMNDGCAVCSPEVMRRVADDLDLEEIPSAVQARVGGAKGMWFLDPSADPASKEIYIHITTSQRKFARHDSEKAEDWARSTLFVRGYSKKLPSSRLNIQLIPILAMQGVPFEVFKELLEQHIGTELGGLLDATQDRVALRSWISQNLMARQKYRDIPHFDGGTPKGYDERIMMLLDAGFEPRKCRILVQWITKIFNERYKKVQDNAHISVPLSTTAFCIADPTGTLEEGEVVLQFSEGFLDTVKKTRIHYLEGDILVARSPAFLPTDIQKVRAVLPTPESGLSALKDVIIFSSKGVYPLASMLSGGDYDGDKPFICWDPRLVDNFTNSRSFAAFSAWDPSKYFEHFDTPLRDLLDIGSAAGKNSLNTFFRAGFESDTQKNYLGLCNNLLENYCCHHLPNGGWDKQALYFAKLCAVMVDAPKQGLSPTAAVVADLFNWQRKLPRAEYRLPSTTNDIMEPGETDHILNRLILGVAREVAGRKMAEWKAIENSHTENPDLDLTEMYKRIDAIALQDPGLRRVLVGLNRDIDKVHTAWVSSFINDIREEKSQVRVVVPKVAKLFSAIRPDVDGDIRLTAWFGGGTTAGTMAVTREWELLRASALFYRKHQWNWNFIWYFAGRELCELKARAAGIGGGGISSRMVTGDIYYTLKPDPRLVKKLEVLGDDVSDGSNEASD
ncbi:RNA dependent RNA polymerase-domain-containing protein [Pyronema omphalodes]|nr:RNA dependent RNA polymerase-domain-containing protein [Pyronema omphalodes]